MSILLRKFKSLLLCHTFYRKYHGNSSENAYYMNIFEISLKSFQFYKYFYFILGDQVTLANSNRDLTEALNIIMMISMISLRYAYKRRAKKQGLNPVVHQKNIQKMKIYDLYRIFNFFFEPCRVHQLG